MARNWLRTCSLALSGGSSGAVVTGGGPSDLRVRFEIISHTTQSPNAGNFIISNPSKDLVAQVQNEFTDLTFSAGYEGNSGQIFKGSITETRWGEKEGWTDPLLQIWVVDGDLAYNQSKVSTTLPAGSTPQDMVNTAVQAMAPFGFVLGQVTGVDLSQPKFPRGVPMAGMARDYLREVALNAGATYYLENGKVNIIHKNASLSGGITLNENTGMIGQPIATTYGLIVKCLINPAITLNCNLIIDQSSIVQSKINTSNLGTAFNQNDLLQRQQDLAQLGLSDGSYRVVHYEVEGDTRGNDWFMTCTCVGSQTGHVTPSMAGQGLS